MCVAGNKVDFLKMSQHLIDMRGGSFRMQLILQAAKLWTMKMIFNPYLAAPLNSIADIGKYITK